MSDGGEKQKSSAGRWHESGLEIPEALLNHLSSLPLRRWSWLRHSQRIPSTTGRSLEDSSATVGCVFAKSGISRHHQNPKTNSAAMAWNYTFSHSDWLWISIVFWDAQLDEAICG